MMMRHFLSLSSTENTMSAYSYLALLLSYFDPKRVICVISQNSESQSQGVVNGSIIMRTAKSIMN